MALRAKPPVLKRERFKALIYANMGVGKTHFCCSLPRTYYIDTENSIEGFERFTNMLIENKGDFVFLAEMGEIINEVRNLLFTKHNYTTVVIDSISFPYSYLSHLEAERLGSKANNEGTEYGANLAKAKRFAFYLGILLSRLDMNIIVTSHEKQKYLDGKEVGTIFDISDKVGYSLGTVINLKQMGNSRKAFIHKSRYTELPNGSTIDFDNGYEVLKNLFGEDLFTEEAKIEVPATIDQITEFKRLMEVVHASEEDLQKCLIKAQSQKIEEVNTATMDGFIKGLKKKILGNDKEQI